MKHHKSKKRRHKEPKLTREEIVYQTARELSADTGISYSEALGYTLGIENPYHGWENDLSDEEFQALIDNPYDIYEEDDFDDSREKFI